MTFSSTVKEEVSRLDTTKPESISELSAIIRNSASIDKSILIHLENNFVARRIYKLIKSLYDVTPVITVRKKYFSNGLSYILDVRNKTEEILNDLSIIDSNNNYLNIPKEYIVSDEEAVRAYLRGLFVVSGSVNDPKTSRYHLEFVVDNNSYAQFIKSLLDNYNLNAKIIKRTKNYTVYIKEAEKISDFLRVIKAYNAVLYFEDIRIYRDHKNMTNRLNNCEQANVDKIFMTSSKQIKDIEKLKEYDMIDLLDERLQELIKYRLEYPESSLQELSDIISLETGVKITNSGLNHRFRKIKEIVSNLEKKENEK
ncbi:MAG: DNA-binding protein WhiA [Bacilli bacterium]|nr:DNA-binding protein WhiA [Bacilli bacterium]